MKERLCPEASSSSQNGTLHALVDGGLEAEAGDGYQVASDVGQAVAVCSPSFKTVAGTNGT